MKIIIKGILLAYVLSILIFVLLSAFVVVPPVVHFFVSMAMGYICVDFFWNEAHRETKT